MKVLIAGIPRYGVRLGNVEFGTVVLRPLNGLCYLVTSNMDGTGAKHLTTLASGIRRLTNQDERVIPVDATMYVGGAL